MREGTRVPLVSYEGGCRTVVGTAVVALEGPHFKVTADVSPDFSGVLTKMDLAVSIGDTSNTL